MPHTRLIVNVNSLGSASFNCQPMPIYQAPYGNIALNKPERRSNIPIGLPRPNMDVVDSLFICSIGSADISIVKVNPRNIIILTLLINLIRLLPQ